MGPADLSGILGSMAPGDFMVPDTVQRMPLGTKTTFLDPYYGLQEMVYAQAAAAQEPGSIVYFATGYQATDIPNSAGLGRPVLVAKANMASGSYGWYISDGVCPVSAQASVAVGAAPGITAAGQLGAIAAGKQLNGFTVQIASTGTFTKQGTTNVAALTKRRLQLSNIDGIIVGLAVSGTGIAGGSTVAAIDPSGNFITLSADMTGSATVTVTFTYTGFVVCYIQGPFAQGQIL